MPAESPDTRREAMLAHLQRVYVLARSLSQNEDDAVRLVEETYKQAFATLPAYQDEDDARQWLLHLLTQIHQEQVALATDEATDTSVDESLQPIRRHLADEITARTLPVVLSTLSHQQRLVLLLCEVEDMDCAAAAPLLQLDEATTCAYLEQARAALADAFHSELTRLEQELVATDRPQGWLRSALEQAFEVTFGSVPPTLHTDLLEARLVALADEPPKEETLAETLDEDMQDGNDEKDDLPRSALPMPRIRPLPKTSRTGVAPAIRRGLLVTLLIAVVGLTGYFASRSVEKRPDTNLITLSVNQADDLTATFPTSSLEQAEAFVYGTLGQRLTLPTIDQATLTGVGVRKPAPDVSVPAFLYQDEMANNQTLVLYVYNYALLNRFEDRLSLEPGILRQIQEEQHFDLHDLGERQVLVWRNRDDIYVAVTTGDAESLRHRILFPS